MKKILLLILSLIMVVSAFAACGDSKNATTPKPSTPKVDGPTETEKPEEEKLNVDIDAIDYDGAIVRIVHWGTSNTEFGMAEEDINNDAVNDALYKRNLYTESDLGITLEFNKEDFNYSTVNKFTDRLKAWTEDPSTPVDIIAAQTRMMPTITIQNHLTDLNVFTDSLDFDKAWWPESCRELHEIKGNLYFATGDVSPNLLRMMTLVFVNKTILESRGHNYEEFMEQIINYEWTIDDLILMTEGVWENGDDTNSPGPSEDDTFGLATNWYNSDALYSGCGFTFMLPSSSDSQVFRLSADMPSESVANYVSKMLDWAKTYDAYFGPVGDSKYWSAFKDGRALFMIDRAHRGFDLQATDVNFAIIPTPMLNEDQDEYFTTIGNPVTSYGVSSDSEDMDRAAETIQVLGYHAFNETTPAIFEVSFKGKFSKDDYTIKMFDIVRNAITFDPGRIYDSFLAGPDGEQWQYYPPNIVSFTLTGGREGWTTDKVWTTEFNSAKQKHVRGLIDEANAKLLEYINSQS